MKLHLISALACAVLLACGPASAQTQDQIDAARADAAQYTDAELIDSLRQGMDGVAPGRYQLLKDNFPDEIDDLERRVVAGTRSGRLTPAAAQSLGYQFTVDLYATHGPAMAKAPIPQIMAAVRAQLDALILLREVNLVACHEMGEDGILSERSATSLSSRVVKALAGLSEAQLQALIAGKRTPVEHGPLTQGDIDAIFGAYERGGGKLEIIAAMESADIESYSAAERCDASIALLQAVIDQPPALVARFVAFSQNPTSEIGRSA